MCPLDNPKTNVSSDIFKPALTTPTTIQIPVQTSQPPISSSLQLDPIMDWTGTVPIANQKWDGKQYIRITNNDEFLELSTTTDPKLIPYIETFDPPIISNIVNITANANIDIAKLKVNFNVKNGRALVNFGNSCYFNTAMQLLFVMSNVRQSITQSTNYLDNTDPDVIARKDQYNAIKKLLINMSKSPKNIPVNKFPDYLNVKQAFMGNSLFTQEEDSEEFLVRFLSGLNPNITKEYMIKGKQITYYVKNSLILSTESYKNHIFYVRYNIISENPNATIEDAIYRQYDKIDFLENGNAIPYNGDYVFGYRVYQITTLPVYFIVHLNPIDDMQNKQLNNIQINTTLTLTVNGNTINYFMMGIIIHRNMSINGGHYTALIYDKKVGNSFQYIYYDDAYTEIKSMPIDSKFIERSLYIRDPTEVAYIVLYADITKLK